MPAVEPILVARQRARRMRPWTLGACFLFVGLANAFEADLPQQLSACRDRWRQGEYEATLEQADAAIRGGIHHPEWRVLRIDALLALGRYPEARDELEAALPRFRTSLRLRGRGYEAYRRAGEPSKGRKLLEEFDAIVRQAPWRYADAESLVEIGQAALALGGDPRSILERYFRKAQLEDPKSREAALAIGRLAIAKQDFDLASETFAAALQQFPDDPEFHFGLALAHAYGGDGAQASASVRETLERNPRHAGALLLRAERCFDHEDYAGAEAKIDAVLATNPWHPTAWALRSAVAQLQGDVKNERAFRAMALRQWNADPAVDWLIGQKLSRKYRFAEGADRQRQSLASDPDFLPAKIQLAQDLLRLGREEEGWRLAREARDQDAYDVVAFNLVTLSETVAKFRAIEDDDFILRMDAREAEVYGDRALAILKRAKATLTAKYGVSLPGPVIVEIFPDHADFAVRTFGVPGGSGFLGVCFGAVITVSSPASRGDRDVNWESVLWHEFCHVISLRLSEQKIPRWLSEGISVYEERQADPRWGQRMSRPYQQWILSGERTPIAELSGAFLSPASPEKLQFAYFEASLVVESLVRRYGREALKETLRDLAAGMPAADALERRTGRSLAQLDREIASDAEALARAYAPKADWSDPSVPPAGDPPALEAFVREHPTNVTGLRRWARLLASRERWPEARQTYEQWLAIVPEEEGFSELAEICRRQGDSAGERAALTAWSQTSATATAAEERLLELAGDAEDEAGVVARANALLACRPMHRLARRRLAESAERTGDSASAIRAWRAVLALGPTDPAEAHYRLARLLREQGEIGAARRHAVQAIEEAPRFRAAGRLLLDICRQESPPHE